MTKQLTTSQEYKRKWYIKNRERLSLQHKERYVSDPLFRETKKQNSLRRRKALPEEIKLFQAEYRHDNKDKINLSCKEWRKRNPVKVKFYSGNARARKRNATPSWLSAIHKQQIEGFYWLAKDLRSVTGDNYHVDHIVPLKGKNVCGLHVPWNLQVLPADINLRKNRYGWD
jgi:hypothetical protein